MPSSFEFTGPAPAGFSPAVVIGPGARLVWTSGQVGILPDGTVPVGDWERQTRAVFDNLTAVLDGCGASWSAVVKLTIYVLDAGKLPAIRAVRDEYVNREHPPTSTLVQVAALALPDLLIEVEAVAVLPSA